MSIASSSLPLIISIHALREEGDFQPIRLCQMTRYFYPRPPRGGRPSFGKIGNGSWVFLSTPSARRATPTDLFHLDVICISIHALREEGDARTERRAQRRPEFLSTPSARRATGGSVCVLLRTAQFLSTPSARRATKNILFLQRR